MRMSMSPQVAFPRRYEPTTYIWCIWSESTCEQNTSLTYWKMRVILSLGILFENYQKYFRPTDMFLEMRSGRFLRSSTVFIPIIQNSFAFLGPIPHTFYSYLHTAISRLFLNLFILDMEPVSSTSLAFSHMLWVSPCISLMSSMLLTSLGWLLMAATARTQLNWRVSPVRLYISESYMNFQQMKSFLGKLWLAKCSGRVYQTSRLSLLFYHLNSGYYLVGEGLTSLVGFYRDLSVLWASRLYFGGWGINYLLIGSFLCIYLEMETVLKMFQLYLVVSARGLYSVNLQMTTCEYGFGVSYSYCLDLCYFDNDSSMSFSTFSSFFLGRVQFILFSVVSLAFSDNLGRISAELMSSASSLLFAISAEVIYWLLVLSQIRQSLGFIFLSFFRLSKMNSYLIILSYFTNPRNRWRTISMSVFSLTITNFASVSCILSSNYSICPPWVKMPMIVSLSLSLGGSLYGSSMGMQKDIPEKMPSLAMFFFARFLTSLKMGRRDYLSGDFWRTGMATLSTLRCSKRSMLVVRFMSLIAVVGSAFLINRLDIYIQLAE